MLGDRWLGAQPWAGMLGTRVIILAALYVIGNFCVYQNGALTVWKQLQGEQPSVDMCCRARPWSVQHSGSDVPGIDLLVKHLYKFIWHLIFSEKDNVIFNTDSFCFCYKCL